MKKFAIFAASMLGCAMMSAQPAPGSFEQTWTRGPEWLRDGVIYQVYPSSYKDSDGNGIGDIRGVISELDYIESLGVRAIWFNPLFVSGWIDGGYDVIDFYRVDPRFGTNNDMVELIEKAHAKGIKVMLDLVAGHTSDKHPWFIQSSQDTNLQYSDYYIWSDRLPDAKAERDLETMLKDPNYMQNTIGKWMKSEYPRNKFYMKNFYACQPSLNYGYANPDPSHPWEQGVDAPGPKAVRQELKDIIAFWYGKGVDGFRVDMANSLVKNDKDKKEIMNLWREIREWSDKNYPDHVLMAEWGSPKYCLAAGYNIDMDLNSTKAHNRRMYFDRKHQADGGSYFSLNGGQPSVKDLYGNAWPENKIDSKTTAAEMLKEYYDYFTDCLESTETMGYFATITGNHDHLRINMGARNTPDQLKVMLTWVLTMPMPILYYGDEIGMRSLVDLPNVEGANHNGKERSGARTPMQWTSGETAGFSTCSPDKLYLPVCTEWSPATSYPQYLDWKKNFEAGKVKPIAKGDITVESQDKDPESILNWTRELIALRKSSEALWADSKFIPVFNESQPYPMVYLRSNGKETFLIALNPTGTRKSLTLNDEVSSYRSMTEGVKGIVNPVASLGKGSYKRTGKGDVLTLEATSGIIIRL
uniref:alpha-amylase family glycosyl hydrolase n=1 Tax=Candidatus Cryptobacteroides bacterium TaxID=3085639 RepID=UPI004024C907